MQPSLTDPNRIGQLEGFTHQASFIYFPAENLRAEDIDQIHEWLMIQNDIEFGLTQVAGNGMMVRMLGHGAELLYHNLLILAKMVQESTIVKSVKPEYAG